MNTVTTVACSYCRQPHDVDVAAIENDGWTGWTWFCSEDCERRWQDVSKNEQVKCETCDQLVNVNDVPVMDENQITFEGMPRPTSHAMEVFYYTLYDSPFDAEGYAAYTCGETCDEAFVGSDYDFSYWYCDGCSRMICQRNPRNGWHAHFRFTDDGERICLRCYEEDILENGHTRDEFEAGRIPGMFFSWASHEPLNAGFEKVETTWIQTTATSHAFCERVLGYLDDGYKVVIGYESMAIGGLEGTVSLFVKAPMEQAG